MQKQLIQFRKSILAQMDNDWIDSLEQFRKKEIYKEFYTITENKSKKWIRMTISLESG